MLMSLPVNQNSNSESENSDNPQAKKVYITAMMLAEAAAKTEENEYFANLRKKDRTRKLLILGPLVTGLAIVLIFGFKSFNQSNSESEKTSSPGTSLSSNPTGTVPGGQQVPNEFWTEKPYPTQVQLKDWQLAPYNAPSKGGSVDEQNNAKVALNTKVANYNLSVPGVASNLQGLPSRSAGFTDDTSKVKLPDGTLNPAYTYWTLEGFNENVNFTLQRFVNPLFGNWSNYQYSSAKPFVNDGQYLPILFSGLYDPAYLKTMEGKTPSQWIPVYADWASNDYGMSDQLLPSPAPRWMGTLDSVQTKFNFDSTTQMYTAHVEAAVTYVAWSQGQQILKKHGKITFDVLPGTPTGNRYMLSNSKLEITS